MPKIEDTIAALEAKLKQAKAKKQKIEAHEKAVQAKMKRSQDTRRKIIVGALILDQVDRGQWPRDKLLSMLQGALIREDDRALFGLSPLAETSSSSDVAELI